MAITISQQPQTWTPAYNDQYIVALSDEIAQPGFKYKVDVGIDYILNNSPAFETFTYYHVPRPDGYLVFNGKEVVKNFIQHFFKPYDFDILECVNSKVDVTVDIQEVWTGSTGVTETVNYYAWNAALTENQVFEDNYDYKKYISNSIDNKVRVHSVATVGYNSYPFEKQTMVSDVVLQFVKSSDLSAIKYYVVDTNGVDILDSYTYTGSMTNNKVYQINASPQLAVQQSFTVDVGYYITVEFLMSDLTTVLYSYTYLIEDLCTKHEVNRIYYLNRRGGISSFPFEFLSTQTIDSNTSEVRLGRRYISSGKYSYVPYKHENNIVNTKETYVKTLQTNWLTAQESIYLEELYSSPLKWLVSEELAYGDYFNYVPITSISKPYIINKHENEKLFNYGIEVKLSTEETRQRAI